MKKQPKYSNVSELMNFRFLHLLFVGCGLNSYGQGKISRPSQNHSQTNKPKKYTPKVMISEPDGYINGHGYVDLGLPSGTKWATCNIGASSPEILGEYYAWGETSTKTEYNEDNRKTHRDDNIGGNPDYDAATANWGIRWRLLTNTEFEELIKCCSYKLTIYKDIHGCKIIGPNGKSIFLPAAGFYKGSKLCNSSNNKFWEGGYWATASPTSHTMEYHFYFDCQYIDVFWPDSQYGRSVRPVTE